MNETNEIIYTCDEFYVSYLVERNELATLCDELTSMFSGIEHTGEPETALCVRTGKEGFASVEFYILYGDHREAYRNLSGHGLKACFDYFIDHIDRIACSSSSPKANA